MTTHQELTLADSAIDTVGEIMLNAPLLKEIGTLAKIMADNKVSVPKHLQGAPSDCYAVVLQAVQWRMNPFAVAQKTHLVNGTLGYEAQLINAVIQNSGMITGSFRYEYTGEGNDLRCRVGAILKGDREVTWGEWLGFKDVTTKNSPLWKTNPRQQMGYLQVKNWSRLYCPGAILGVYTQDELQDLPREREIGPASSDTPARTTGARSDALASRLWDEEVVDAEVATDESPVAATDAPEPEPEPEPTVTYAMVADKINGATSQAVLSDLANSAIPEFLHEGDNGMYREELMALYKTRRQQIQVVEDEKALSKK